MYAFQHKSAHTRANTQGRKKKIQERLKKKEQKSRLAFTNTRCFRRRIFERIRSDLLLRFLILILKRNERRTLETITGVPAAAPGCAREKKAAPKAPKTKQRLSSIFPHADDFYFHYAPVRSLLFASLMCLSVAQTRGRVLKVKRHLL